MQPSRMYFYAYFSNILHIYSCNCIITGVSSSQFRQENRAAGIPRQIGDKMAEKQKVVLAWLKETYGYDVVACCINVGQESELTNLDERAKSSGACKLYELDCIDEFADEYIAPCIQAHAVYENKYLLGTSMARPLIAKKLVEVARGTCAGHPHHRTVARSQVADAVP